MRKKYHLKPSFCSSCKGKCCKRAAGIYLPSDFKPEELTPDSIFAMLQSGKFSIDWWDDDPRPGKNELSQAYYIRPRHVGAPAINGSWGGRCVNLSDETGCTLPNNKKPAQCRELIPMSPEGEGCHVSDKKFEKQGMSIEWVPYQAVIIEAINKFRDHEEN